MLATRAWCSGLAGLLQIPPNVMHWGEVVGDEPVLNLDIFTPVREEYAPRHDEAGWKAGGTRVVTDCNAPIPQAISVSAY